MKKAIYIMAAAAVLAGCSSEEELNTGSGIADNVVHITANVDDNQTRASYTNSTLDDFGFAIYNSHNNKCSYGNVKVTKSGDVWTPAEQMLWESADQEVDIYAYAPYSDQYKNIYETTSFRVDVEQDQRSADDNWYDLLLFKASGFKPGENSGTVPVTFKHALSQLNVTISLRGEFAVENAVNNLQLGSTKLTGNCDFTTQKVTADSQSLTAWIDAQYTGYTAATSSSNAKVKFSCILIPQSIGANSLRFNILKGSLLVGYWTLPDAITFEQGKSYQLNLTFGKDGVKMSGIDVKDWSAGSDIEGGKAFAKYDANCNIYPLTLGQQFKLDNNGTVGSVIYCEPYSGDNVSHKALVLVSFGTSSTYANGNKNASYRYPTKDEWLIIGRNFNESSYRDKIRAGDGNGNSLALGLAGGILATGKNTSFWGYETTGYFYWYDEGYHYQWKDGQPTDSKAIPLVVKEVTW